MYLNTKRR